MTSMLLNPEEVAARREARRLEDAEKFETAKAFAAQHKITIKPVFDGKLYEIQTPFGEVNWFSAIPGDPDVGDLPTPLARSIVEFVPKPADLLQFVTIVVACVNLHREKMQ